MFYEEITAQQDLSYISICSIYSLSILYNSKYIQMTSSLGTNDVVVQMIHYINLRNLNLVLLNPVVKYIVMFCPPVSEKKKKKKKKQQQNICL